MNLLSIIDQFKTGLLQTGWLEYIAVFAGIASVWFSRKENILVYPVGLINTCIYIYLSVHGHLYGEASVNLYYTIMSIYGWIIWSKKDTTQHRPIIQIQFSTPREWLWQLLFFSGFYIVIYSSLSWLKESFAPEAIPWADAFASATAYTGMWLMARKKVESWIWWIATNIASIPLYFIKGYVFTSVQFLVLLILAIAGLLSWRKKALHAGS
ncbi:MAG: nicotinamide riboside transporter PnuC [Sediminibacterium sp.]|jgi:nicotinamide mononucleotide transporter|nr:nicotinamide mononucleotide transporter [Chitinophagaceae bacterium]MCA6448353.1 nicotinamide mononucleotide transporter [Chitinophagaceae bacterium]